MHSLFIMQNVPYGLFSIQHESFKLQILKLVICLTNELCSHTAF